MSRSPCAEFPSDNPTLHEGSSWICLEVLGGPRAECVVREPAPPPVGIRAPQSLGPPLAKAAPRASVSAQGEPLPSEPFERFVQTLARVALAAGGTRAAATIACVLGSEPIRADSLSDAVQATLVERGFWSARGPSDHLLATRTAFRALLEGAPADFSACGSATLDTWSAELLTALLGWPAFRAEEVRRDLRRAGVAAFGLLARAA